ncbi:GATA-type zinc finger transcription factor [Mucor lusitanicus CBS 277.49]|uniref:GATA-type zinc finger transcription factor n=1 Tax=Mucor lusitanicus CBS 277.49 TaxID=747725 RepID=A0A168M3P4_MUCCL|nr:GATA-type zinc finger transcription factor [Mucor lusitanicus CBS 277.49]
MDYGVKAGDMLKSKSLLDFIHPDELSLATTDLLNFVRIKTLAGAVTRCRLRSIQSLIHQEQHHRDNAKVDNLQNWIITDVVMYTATNNSILTFFHSLQQLEIDNTATNCNNLSRHTNLLDTPIPANPTTTTLTPIITTNNSILSATTNVNCCGTGQLNPGVNNLTFSCFQITALKTEERLYYNSDHIRSSSNSTTGDNSSKDAIATSESSDNTRSPLPRAWRGRFGVFEKKCENCQTNTSPEWRKGPGGHKT